MQSRGAGLSELHNPHGAAPTKASAATIAGSQAFCPRLRPWLPPPVRHPSWPSSSPRRWTTRFTRPIAAAPLQRPPATGRRSAEASVEEQEDPVAYPIPLTDAPFTPADPWHGPPPHPRWLAVRARWLTTRSTKWISSTRWGPEMGDQWLRPLLWTIWELFSWSLESMLGLLPYKVSVWFSICSKKFTSVTQPMELQGSWIGRYSAAKWVFQQGTIECLGLALIFCRILEFRWVFLNIRPIRTHRGSYVCMYVVQTKQMSSL